MSNLKIYPSGFLGSSNVVMSEPIDLNTIRHQLFDVTAITTAKSVTHSKAVNDMWGKILCGDTCVNSFEFLEEVLKLGKTSFGTYVIGDWFKAQTQSPRHSEYHKQWIDETLNYIFVGIPRQYTYNVWNILFNDDKHTSGVKESQQVKNFFGEFGNAKGITTTDFINLWLLQPNGFKDLYQSLSLLFGKY